MENWLNINQYRSLEWGLNSNEEKLCAYYSRKHEWVTTRIKQDDGDFLCISISKLMAELPSIGTAKSNFSRALNNLATKRVFDKRVNDKNKKEVYYRFNPLFLDCWRGKNDIKLDMDFSTDNKCYRIGTSVTELEQGVTELEQGVTELEPISINNQINNQINNNHKNIDVDKASLKIRNKNTKLEFEKILDLYPETINNTKNKIIEAYGVFKSLSPVERFNLAKAIRNYSKTSNVKNQSTSKYIQSIHTFMTKSYTEFINGIPKNYEYAEDFEPKKSEMGAVDSACSITYEQKDINKINDIALKFDSIKRDIANGMDIIEVENKAKGIFNEKEFDAIFVKMGGGKNIESFSSMRLAESLVDLLRVEQDA